jgi:hypothetical protein
VKIRATCKRDGRDFMMEQSIAAGGECPWDGEPFNADYAATLVEAMRRAEEAGTALVEALTTIADLNPEFSVHSDTIVEPIRAELARLDRRLIRRG